LVARTPIASSTSLSATALRGLIQLLGSPGFPKQLLVELQVLMDVRHLSIIAFDDQLVAHLAGAESLGRVAAAKAAGKIYERSLLYRYDPNVRVIQSDTEGDEPLLLRLRAREITDTEYRTEIFERFNLVDRLSVLDHGSGHWHAINFYRESRSGEFDAADIAIFQSAAGVIAALVGKHFAMAPPSAERTARKPSVEMFEALVGGLDERLTTRQIQVCARALMGMTNVAVGLSLGIQVPTVATLRKRAYATLKISSLNELFALCLAAQASAGNNP
jgi:DNA-binding CsgD family transcriptional regulator